MKNILLKGLFVSASIIFATSSVSAMTCTNLTKSLSKGSENSEVLTLQQFLFDGGYLTAKPNGYFGAGTAAAVKKFQIANGMSPVGSVGAGTRGKLKDVSCDKSSSTVMSTSIKTENPQVVKNDSGLVSYKVTGGAANIVFDSITNSVWAPSYKNISKIDTKNGSEVVFNKTVGDSGSVVFDNISSSVWTLSSRGSYVTKTNIKTGESVDIEVGKFPKYIVFDDVTNSIWIANDRTSFLKKIDVKTNKVSEYLVGRNINSMTFSKEMSSIFVTHYQKEFLSKVDVKTGSSTDFALDVVPSGSVVDTITNSVWVGGSAKDPEAGNESVDVLSKINLATGEVKKYILGRSLRGRGMLGNYSYVNLIFNAETSSIWTPSRTSNAITKINVNTGEIKEYTIGDKFGAQKIEYDPITKSIWAITYSGIVSKINVITGIITEFTIDKKIATESVFANDLTFDSSTNSILVSSQGFIYKIQSK
jgi:streptogramin lyase